MEKSVKKQSLFPVMGDITTFPTPDDLTEEETMIQEMVTQFVEGDILPAIDQFETVDNALIKDFMTASGELGLMGVEVEEEYGGSALGKKVSGIIAEKMGYGASFSVAFNIHSGVGLLPYVLYATDKQKESYLPKLASGRWIGAYALTEPNAGSDALAGSTRARWEADTKTFVLNGEKQWITNAHLANVYVVFAKVKGKMTAFIVERETPGVSVGPEENKLGIRASSTATLRLDEVRVSKEQVLGEVGKGHYIAFNILNLARLKLAFSNIGMAKQAMELAIQYGLERKQFQRPIISFPIIQEKIARMAVSIYGAESMAYYTADLLDGIEARSLVRELSDYMMDCAINKVRASEALDFVVDEALQIHGGYGFMEDYPIARMYRDARINRIFEGTNEINRLTIAKALLKAYQEDGQILKASFIEETDRKPTSRNMQWIEASLQLLEGVLDDLPTMDRQTMDEYQDYLRVLADIVTKIYEMKVALFRSLKDEPNETKEAVATIICETGYQQIERQTIQLIASLLSDDAEKARVISAIKQKEVGAYSDLFAKQKAIAEKQIAAGKYCV